MSVQHSPPFKLPQSSKNKIIIQTTKEGLCWSSRKFQADYPDQLNGYMTKQQYENAVNRLQTTWFRTKIVYWSISVALPILGLILVLLSITFFKKNGALLVGGILILFMGLCISCFGFILITNKYLYHLHIEIQVLNTKFSNSGIVWSLHLFEYYDENISKNCLEMWVEVDLPSSPIVVVSSSNTLGGSHKQPLSIAIQSTPSFDNLSLGNESSTSSDFTYDSNSYTVSTTNNNNNNNNFISIDIQNLPSISIDQPQQQ